MPKAYWIASGPLLKGLRKLLGKNAHVTQIPTKQMFLLAGCDEKYGK
jgi:hypothetical protein